MGTDTVTGKGLNPMGRWVISYDIHDDKIRNKVAGVLLGYGERVQFSVFECDLGKNELEALVDQLSNLIERTDSIRYYGICQTCQKLILVSGKDAPIQEREYLII